MSVCLFARISEKINISKFYNIFCMLPVAVARPFSDNSAGLYTSGFVDDVTFSHNAPNWVESNTMLFCQVCLVVAMEAKLLTTTALLSNVNGKVNRMTECLQPGVTVPALTLVPSTILYCLVAQE